MAIVISYMFLKHLPIIIIGMIAVTVKIKHLVSAVKEKNKGRILWELVVLVLMLAIVSSLLIFY